jgi:small ligand-binding sensory domain FIST
LAIKEEVDKFEPGNFLVRHIVSTDLEKGWLELAATCRLGQAMQFQMRDGKSAAEELKARFQKIHETHGSPFAALLCGGQGRGKKLYGAADRDLRILEEHLGIFPLAGFFSNGEFGPAQGVAAFHEHSLCAVLFYPAETSIEEDPEN